MAVRRLRSKRFNGKSYRFWGGGINKSKARLKAEELRNSGNSVRVEKITSPILGNDGRPIPYSVSNPFYVLWIRKA